MPLKDCLKTLGKDLPDGDRAFLEQELADGATDVEAIQALETKIQAEIDSLVRVVEEGGGTVVREGDVEALRVKSAVQLAEQDRQWANWRPSETKAGKINGAPEWVNRAKEPKKALRKMERELTNRIKEGLTGRMWYEESTRRVMDIVNNNLQDAEKLIQLIAIYSPQANVQVNTGFAVKAWNQYKRNEPITASNNAVKDGKATAALYENKPFTGRKIGSFYGNLMYDLLVQYPKAKEVLAIDQELLDAVESPVTIDMWMARAFGYNSDAIGDDKGSGKYSFSEGYLKRITARLNKRLEPGQERWTGHQVQAAIWTSMKARYELPWIKQKTNRESTRRGLSRKKGNGYERVNQEVKTLQKHAAIWRKNAMQVTGAEATEFANETAASFETFLDQMTQVISWEPIPSGVALEINTWPESVQRQFMRDAASIIQSEDGADMLADLVGVPLSYVRGSMRGSGEAVNRNYLSYLVPEKSGGFSTQEASAYARAIQYIYRQETVPVFRADPRAMNSIKAREAQQFKVINTETGKMVPKSRVDTLTEAREKLAEKGEGFEIRGGNHAVTAGLQFKEQLSQKTINSVLELLKETYGEAAGLTVTGPNEITIVNFRDDATKIPRLDDEIFLDQLDVLEDNLQDMGVETISHFWTEGENGPTQDYQADPEGSAILSAESLAGRSDLQAWIRDRRQEFDDLLEAYGRDQIPAREVEARQVDYLAQRTGYHGTGAEYLQGNQLRTKYIGGGTGTGAVNFGWGLYFASTEEIAEGFRQDIIEMKGGTGGLYRVNLLPEDDEYLNWDALVTDQPQRILDIILEASGRSLEYWQTIEFTGGDFYEMLARDSALGTELERKKEVSLTLLALGIKGNKFRNPDKAGWKNEMNYVIFDDTQVEVIDRLSQSAKWYSALERAAKGLKQKKGPGSQMLGSLKKQPGVKEEELDWLGVADYLEGQGSITKEEVLAFIQQGGVQVDDVLLGRDDKVNIMMWRPARHPVAFFLDGERFYLNPDGTINDALLEDDVDQSWNDFTQFQEVNALSDPGGVMQTVQLMDYHEIFAVETTEEEADEDTGPPGWYITPAYESDIFNDDINLGPYETQREAEAGAYQYAQGVLAETGPVEGGLTASGQPEHATWVLPGGQNYKELLLTIPKAGRPVPGQPKTEVAQIPSPVPALTLDQAQNRLGSDQVVYYINPMDDPANPMVVELTTLQDYDDYKNNVQDEEGYFSPYNPNAGQLTEMVEGYTGFVVVPTEDVAQEMNEIMASAIEQEGYGVNEFLDSWDGDYGWNDESGAYEFQNVPLWLFESMDEGRRQLGLGIFEDLVQPQAGGDVIGGGVPVPDSQSGFDHDSPKPYRGGHYHVDNVLAHIRFNDRMVDGKKVLFVEEIQSDWHQQGRKRGYGQNPATPFIVKRMMIEEFGDKGRVEFENWGPLLVDYFNLPEDKRGDLVVDGGWTEDNEKRLLAAAARYKINTIPDAPFKKTWPLLAMKRMIRYAAENGYERVSWTNGLQQAQRYNLAQAVDKLEVTPTSEGTGYQLVGWKNGAENINKNISADELADHIGDELATKVHIGPEGKMKQQKDLGKKLQELDNQFNAMVDSYQPTGLNKNTYRLTVFNAVRERNVRTGEKPFSLRSMNDADFAALIKVVEQRDDTFIEWESTERGTVTLEGIDLEVGGKGMIGFYDKMLPTIANKYIKKFGAKVEFQNLRDPRMVAVPQPQADYVPATVTDPRVNQMPTEDLRAMLVFNDPNGEFEDATRAALMETYGQWQQEDPGGQPLFDFYVERTGYTLPAAVDAPLLVDGRLNREGYVSVAMENRLNTLIESELEGGDNVEAVNELFGDDALLELHELNQMAVSEGATQDLEIERIREEIIELYMERLNTEYSVTAELPESMVRWNEPAPNLAIPIQDWDSIQTNANMARNLEDGSEAQINAENALFAQTADIFGIEWDDQTHGSFLIRASTDERIDYAMQTITPMALPQPVPAQLPAPAAAPATAQRDALEALAAEARTDDAALDRFIGAMDEHYGLNLEESLDVQEAQTLDEAVDAAWGIASQEPQYADEQDAMAAEPFVALAEEGINPDLTPMEMIPDAPVAELDEGEVNDAVRAMMYGNITIEEFNEQVDAEIMTEENWDTLVPGQDTGDETLFDIDSGNAVDRIMAWSEDPAHAPEAMPPAAPALPAPDPRAYFQAYTIEGLTQEYHNFITAEGLPDVSADELPGEDVIGRENQERVNEFIERWEAAQQREDDSLVPTRLMEGIELSRGHDHIYHWGDTHWNPIVDGESYDVRIPVETDIEGDWMKGTLHVRVRIPNEPEGWDRQDPLEGIAILNTPEYTFTIDDMSVGDWQIVQAGTGPTMPAPVAAPQMRALPEEIPQQPSFDVTEEMVKMAMEGQALFQDRPEEEERGRFYPNVDGQRVIQLTEVSDLSSFLHEGSHLYLDVQRIWAKKYGMTENQQAMLKWLGAKDFDNITVEQHETWAETFEVYLREGKAPSIGLRRAFASFASWLKRVYTTLADPRLERAKLDPEITEIFDRLLATQEEIDMAALRPEYAQLFRSQEQAGMTDAAWEKYQKDQVKKKETAEMTLDEKVIKQFKRMKSKEWAAEKAPLAQQEAERIGQEPIYQLLSEAREIKNDKGKVIHDGRVDWHKLQKAVGGLPAGKLKTIGGGVDPGLYADKYGFASVKDMYNKIAAVPNLKDASDQAAEQIMVAKYGDILNDGSLETEVREAMLNEEQAKTVIAELRAEGTAHGQRVDRATLKHQAAQLIGTYTYKEIRPTKFYNAMIKAVKAAATAKDPTQDKINQLANHYLYRAAMDAKKQMDKDRKFVRNVQNRVAAGKYKPAQVDSQYIEGMANLAMAYDMRLTPEERAEYGRRVLDFYEGQTKPYNEQTGEGSENAELFGLEMLDPNLVAAVRYRHENGSLEGFVVKTFDEMTVEEVSGVTDMLEHLRYVGGQIADRAAAEVAAIREAGLESIETNGGKDSKVQRGKQRKWKMAKLTWGDFWSSMSSLGNMVRKMDGFKEGGWAFDNIYRPVQEAIDAKMDLQLEMFKQMESFMAQMPSVGLRKDDAEDFTKEDGTTDDFSSEEIFMMAVYWGTDSSREALMQGHELTEGDVMELMNRLTQPQLELANQVWAMNESQWPKLQEAAKRMLGVAPPKLAAAPFMVNGVSMTGGHMQLMYDSQALELADEAMRGMNTSNVVPMRQGSTHARKGSGGRPVLLDTQNITQSMEEKTHYIAFSEAGRKLRGILNNKQIQNVIEKKHGAPFYENLIHSITAITRAEPARETSRSFARLNRWMRKNATLMHLGYSLRNVMQQFPAALISAREVGPLKFTQAMGMFAANPLKMRDEINAKSAKMRDRAQLINRDSREAMKKILATTKGERFWEQAKSAAFVLQTTVDMTVAYPTWYARYNDSMEKHGDEKRAVIEADRAVAETVGSGHDAYLGRIMQSNQSEFVKTFTIFGSWFNAYYQRLYKASKGGDHLNIFTNPALLMDAVIMPIIVANLTQIVIGDWPDEDEEVEDYVLKNSLKFMVATIPVLRDAASFHEGFTPTTPMSALPAAMVRIPREVESFMEGRQSGLKLVADVGRATGTVVPLPGSGNFWRLFDYIDSYMQGEEGDTFNPYLALTEGADKDK